MYRALLIASLLTSIGGATLAQPRATSLWDGVYTAAQADRGHVLYQRYCASCHGKYLEGTDSEPPLGLAYPETARRGRPPLTGWQFRANWTDLALAALFERQRISMPQERPGSLSRQQNADILAFVLQQNGYPSGRRELVGREPQLGGIVFAGW